MNKYLEIGKIINKRGIRGELKIEPYCDSLEDFFGIDSVHFMPDGSDEPIKIESCKNYKGFVYLKLSGIDNPEMADRMRGKSIYVDRDVMDIPDDRIFIADIIGLDVIDAKSGKVYGKVKDIINYGRYDTYVISGDRKEYMMPAVDEFLDRIEIETGVFVTPIPGLFDDAEEIHNNEI